MNTLFNILQGVAVGIALFLVPIGIAQITIDGDWLAGLSAAALGATYLAICSADYTRRILERRNARQETPDA